MTPWTVGQPGSSVHGILQARILEWVAIPFSRDLPNSGIEPGYPASQEDSLPSTPTLYKLENEHRQTSKMRRPYNHIPPLDKTSRSTSDHSERRCSKINDNALLPRNKNDLGKFTQAVLQKVVLNS